LNLSPPSVAETPAPPPVQEFDLSGGLGEVTRPPEPAPTEIPEVPAFNFEDSKAEVDYYLEQGFLDEARNAVQALEEKFPGNPLIADLRSRVEKRSAPQPKAEEAAVSEAVSPRGEGKMPIAPEPTLPPETPMEAPAPVETPIPARAEVAQPTGEQPPAKVPPEEVSVGAGSVAPPAPSASSDPLGGLIGDLEASLDGIETGVPSAPPPAQRHEPAPMPSAPSDGDAASPLSGFLDELREGDQAQAAQDDPQTHYDLGVAFREMNLLDEAIGEFQKVVKGAQKGKFPPNFLQVCTLLALCFMDKKMPAIAAKWYLRALELPDLDEEATMAVQYDLGIAYEQAGDMKSALEKFSEVYSQNIDYRDVAEKIRQLQTKS